MSLSYNEFDDFHRRSGDGSSDSVDDLIEESSIYTTRWGSTASTRFNPNDTDAHGQPIPDDRRERLERLLDLHTGKGEQSRKQDIRHSHMINDAKTFMSTINMPSSLEKRVLSIIESIDMSADTFGIYPYETVILAVCTLVYDEFLSDTYSIENGETVLEKRLQHRESFQELMDVCDVSHRDLQQVRNIVRTRTDAF